VFAIGAPNGAAGPPGTTGDVAPNSLAAGNAEATWLNAGAAEVHPCGTDNTPSEAARPAPAVTAASPIPGEPTAPAPEPQPLLSTDPNAWNPLPKVLVVDPIGFISKPAEPSIDMPEVDIDADEAAPDTRLVPEVSAVDDVMVVSGDVVDETEVAADASPCSALGIAAEVSGVDNTELNGVDTAEVSGDTICMPVPAEVPAAWVTAVASPAAPAGLVVSSGVVKAVNVDAAEAAPA
jgi:hypothetical protein